MFSFKAVISKIEIHSPELKSFELKIPDEVTFSHLPGQSVSVLMPREDGQKPRARPYTIASAPHEKGILKLIVDRVPGGVTSNWLHERAVGDTIDIQGSYGRFFLIRPLAEHLFFFCHGSGIAPFRSMILDLLNQNVGSQMTLFFENESESATPYHEEFLSLSKNNKNFTYCLILKEGSEDSISSLEANATENVTYLDSSHAYICGLKAKIKSVRDVLEDKGFSNNCIKVEAYD